MAARAPDGRGGEEMVKAPGALVVSAYGPCPDVRQVATPALALPGRGRLLFVDLGGGRDRLGGSALAQVHGQVGDVPPDVDDPARLARAFAVTQDLLGRGLVSAGHDRSDGGLLTTVLEMGFAGNTGLELDLDADSEILPRLFAEELGLVLEVDEADVPAALDAYGGRDVPCVAIGRTREDTSVVVRHGSRVVLDDDVRNLRDLWEETSFRLDRLQADAECVEEEQRGLRDRKGPSFVVSFAPAPTPASLLAREGKPRVAILREEGSNGDREMTSAFYLAGFEPWDVTMSDLVEGRVDLESFRGLVAVGGFSYADVLDAAKGWAGVIRFHEDVRRQFDAFQARPDTFSLGVCNGCQLLALLGWVPWEGLADEKQVRFVRNRSGRFESRFSNVRIDDSPSLLLEGMAGSVLGVWVAHGEGRVLFPDPAVRARIETEGLAPLRYADDDGRPTERYPMNPNGSPGGVAGLCSADGRHLAMMPHPERAFLTWQWGWMPRDLEQELRASPWLRMFQNARRWCEESVPA
jgi:phosphoribosylformylglycinamidine synthase